MSTPQNQVFVGTNQTNVITVNTPGPQGPTGPMGNPGVTGPAGGPTGPTGPSGYLANIELAATLPAGDSDNFSPFNYIPGTTNALILTPAADSSTLLGLAAAGTPNGFTLLILNASAVYSFKIESQSSITPANQFVTANNATVVLAPYFEITLTYYTGYGWAVTGSVPSYSTQLVTTGGTATVNPSFMDAKVILDGAATTFALTFPTAFASEQIVRLLSNTAVSVAFSVVGSGDGSTINGVPATTTATTGYAWQYRKSNTTWYRLY
jgi:hypothetical protein